MEAIETHTAGVSEEPLTPLAFLRRSALVWRDRPAVLDGEREWTYGEHLERVERVVGMLREIGVRGGDRVAAILPNVAAMIELHYAVPGCGAVLVPINTRLAAGDYAHILDHSGARVLIATSKLREPIEAALAAGGGGVERTIWLDEEDPSACEYEGALAGATPAPLGTVADERGLLSINYTSGTTGRPRGVMTCHRGAYLHSLGVIAEARLQATSSYLWTLPMFHCNGWAYAWAVTAMGGRHVCLPRVDPEEIWRRLGAGQVTHMCAAPTVLTMMLSSPAAAACPQPVSLFIGGAPPAPALIEKGEALGIGITHLYGLTETYGPIAVCAWNPAWDDRSEAERFRLRARQGVGTVVSERLRVVDEEMRDVPADGATLGEVVMRGNNVMLGYYEDPEATAEAFRGGWFHSGDLAVIHPDGYVELRDRAKDIVISGGENISTIEVEQALAAHPDVAEVAVVGAPDERWIEVPVAYLTALPGHDPDPAELIEFARARLARFKVPKVFEIVDELPKTGTGKVQKFILRERARSGTTPT